MLLPVVSSARCSSIPSTGCCLAGAPVSGLITGISDFLLSLIFAAPPLVVQQMRRREWTSNSRRTRRVITHYFVLRKSSKHRVNSCPNPTSSALYSSSASNSISPVNFLPLILCQYSFVVKVVGDSLLAESDVGHENFGTFANLKFFNFSWSSLSIPCCVIIELQAVRLFG